MCRDLTKEWKDVKWVKWGEESELIRSCRRWAVSSRPADGQPTVDPRLTAPVSVRITATKFCTGCGRPAGGQQAASRPAQKLKSSIVPEQSASGRSASRLADPNQRLAAR